ncbi:MAG TPA: hypothetical protein DEQ43_03620, partial [Nocardioides bacterium]|nr:hypothetical protein [Nocardioides sp.]
ACDNGDDIPGAGSADDTAGAHDSSSADDGGSSSDSSDGPDEPAGSIATNVKKKTGVPVSTLLTVSAENGRLSTVDVAGSGDVGALTGAISGDGA